MRLTRWAETSRQERLVQRFSRFSIRLSTTLESASVDVSPSASISLIVGSIKGRCRQLDRLIAFSCKKRGFCPSRGARRMAESAAILVDEVFPEQQVRQWMLSVRYPLRFLFASRPAVVGRVLPARRRGGAAGSTTEARAVV